MIPVKIQVMLMTCLIALAGCKADYEAMAKQRIEYANMNQGDVVIAAFQESDKSHYMQGVSLAVEQINQTHGGVLGRPLKLIVEQDHDDFESSKPIIRRIAENPEVSMVLGHRNDKVAIPASVVYEKSQILFFPSFTSSKKLTSHGSLFTFRLLPDNIHMAGQISSTARNMKFKKIAVLFDRADKYRGFSLLLRQEAVKKGLELVTIHSFYSQTVNYRPFLSDLKKKEFDAVFVSASDKTAARLVRQMREMGITAPILGPSELGSDEFKTSAGNAGDNTIVPTAYNVLSDSRINQDFVNSYRDKYEQLPDAEAAQGYDAVMLFADKVETAGSSLPSSLATSVRFSPAWTGVTGTFRFNKKGDIEGKNYYFQVLKNEEWQPLMAAN